MKRITGSFNVALTAQPVTEGAGIGRNRLDKQFHGPLEASSLGEMLGFYDPSSQSGGYVALELVTGSLEGRSGTFLLQHSSTITPEAAEQSITVVPNSGTAELRGLRGSMTIENKAGAHTYHFEYDLPEP